METNETCINFIIIKVSKFHYIKVKNQKYYFILLRKKRVYSKVEIEDELYYPKVVKKRQT